MNESTALTHAETDSKSDEALAEEAKAHLAQHPELQTVVEFIQVIRNVDLTELNAEKRRALLPATERMHALTQRRDLRGTATSVLTRVPEDAAYGMSPDFQASLINQVVDACKTTEDFDKAFAPEDLAVYVDGALLMHSHWAQFRWEQDDDPHRDVVASFIESLLADREGYVLDGKSVELESILKPWDVLNVIDVDVLLDCLPREIQKKLFKAWHTWEAQHVDEAWHALDYIDIATPRILVQHIKLADLKGVVMLGMERMGFVPKQKPAEDKPAEAEEQNPKA
ncbi:hypothetical protein HZC53_00660 [Candidatus Uhrbacteria bacterium]|nr:hypothetical protein [Candidatus Uhrbacteria bacterium]